MLFRGMFASYDTNKYSKYVICINTCITRIHGNLELIDVSTLTCCKQAWAVGVAWRNVGLEDAEERDVLEEWVAEQWVIEPNM